MTEEEQKLIKRLEDDIELVYFPSNFGKGEFIMNINLSDLKIILKLISKLQADIDIKDKVIENLEKENKELRKHILNYQGTTGILLKMEDKDE